MKRIEPDDLATVSPPPREATQRRVLAALRSHGPMARVELARRLALSPATITETVANLIRSEVLVADGEGSAIGRGRPRVDVRFNGALGAVIAAWIGLDRVELALVDAASHWRAERTVRLPLQSCDGAGVIAGLAGVIADFRREHSRRHRIAAIGIACQGYVDSERGRVAWSPVLSCRDVPLADGLQKRLRLPVVLDNDAATLALALAQRDRRLRKGRAACVMIGEGVGLGLLLDGGLYRGARSGGSEFGHIRLDRRGPQCRCGARGCIEATLADYALWRDAELIRGRPHPQHAASEADLAGIADEARAGSRALGSLFEGAGRALGDGLGIIIQMLEPDHIVISGPGVRAQDLLEPALAARLDVVAIPELRQLADIRFVAYEPRMRLEGIVTKALERLDAAVRV